MPYVMPILLSFIVHALLLNFAFSQFPPKPENTTTLQSRFHEGITISFKEVSNEMLLSAAVLGNGNPVGFLSLSAALRTLRPFKSYLMIDIQEMKSPRPSIPILLCRFKHLKQFTDGCKLVAWNM